MRKIKRSRNIYRTRRQSDNNPLKTILIIVFSVVLLFVGFSIAGPIMKFFSGQLKAPTTSSAASNITSAGGNSSKPVVSSNTKSSSIHGIFLPKNYIGDLNVLDNAIIGAKKADINLAILDLKSEDGILNYSSKIDLAVKNKLVAANAPDSTLATAKLKAAGITAAARICCFKDPATPVSLRDMAVLYAPNHSSRWIDAFNQSWLNPYSDNAQQYIIDIAKEAVSNGFKYIILDDVEFPSSGNPAKYAWFSDSNIPKEEQLRIFVANATKQINAVGGKVIIHMPGMASIGQANALTGQDQNLFGFSADYFSPDLSPSEFGAQAVQIAGKTIISPDLTPAATVAATAQYISTLADKTKLNNTIPFIQAYTNTSLGNGFYKNYISDDINAEAAALKTNGYANFILFNPSGNYDYAGLKLK
jgi:hypothetical protein